MFPDTFGSLLAELERMKRDPRFLAALGTAGSREESKGDFHGSERARTGGRQRSPGMDVPSDPMQGEAYAHVVQKRKISC